MSERLEAHRQAALNVLDIRRLSNFRFFSGSPS